MADEEVVAEVVTPEAPSEVQAELPLVAEAAVETPAESAPETPAVPAEEPKTDWRDKELKAKHRRQKELERVLAEKDAEIQTKDALLAKFNQGKTEETPALPADEIERRVQQELTQRTYIEQSQKVAKSGEDTYKEAWKDAVSNLEILGGFDMNTMNGVLATDDPAKVLFELGKSPEKYHQIMALPLERRIIEMGKLAMQPVTKQISNAPAPVSPVGGRAAPAKDTLSDKLDDDQWFAIRRKQRMERYNAAHSPRR